MIKFYDPTVALYPIEGVHKQAILVLLSERVAVGGIYSLGSLTLSSTKSVLWLVTTQINKSMIENLLFLKAIGCSSLRGGGSELGTIKTLTYGSN